jgi:hypothetical protein
VSTSTPLAGGALKRKKTISVRKLGVPARPGRSADIARPDCLRSARFSARDLSFHLFIVKAPRRTRLKGNSFLRLTKRRSALVGDRLKNTHYKQVTGLTPIPANRTRKIPRRIADLAETVEEICAQCPSKKNTVTASSPSLRSSCRPFPNGNGSDLCLVPKQNT